MATNMRMIKNSLSQAYTNDGIADLHTPAAAELRLKVGLSLDWFSFSWGL